MPNEAEMREQRQRTILSILRRTVVQRQEELVERLAERGYAVTQSSVSRDLRDLAVAKIAGRYRAPAAPTGADDALEDVAHYLVDARPAGPHLTVVRTRTGAAQTVGLGIDRAAWPEVVGTVAGDDTVFVATAAARDQSRVLRRLHTIVAATAAGSRAETLR